MKQYEVIQHEKLNFDQHCLAYPTEWIKELDGVQVYKTFIPYTYELTKIVYFVSGTNGDEFGQFETLKKAMEKFNFMLTVPRDKRREYDQ